MSNNLRKIRRSQELSQQALADLASVSRGTVIKIELDDRAPTVEVAKRLSDALGVSIEQLFFGKDGNNGVQNKERKVTP